MEAAGILPNRPPDSHTMHDGLPAYRKQPRTDSLGNAHHGRELEDAKPSLSIVQSFSRLW